MSDLVFPIPNGRASWQKNMSQSWDIIEEKSASGRRRTLCQQVLPAWSMDAKFPNLNRNEKDILLGFYAQCRGRFRSFWYKDYDNHVEKQILQKLQDGRYQCVVVVGGYYEVVEKVDNLKVFVNGVETNNFTEEDGKITLSTTSEVTASYDFYWKVCFSGAISISQKFQDLYSASVKLEVVRE